MPTESRGPLSLEAALRQANAEWAAALDALRQARQRIMAAEPRDQKDAEGALEEAERLVERAGDRLAEIAGKLADARRNGGRP